jgi:hypothetical protein
MREKLAGLLVYLILFIIVAGTIFFVVFTTFRHKYTGTAATIDTGEKEYSKVLDNKDIYFMFIESVLDRPNGPNLVIVYKDGSVVRASTEYRYSIEESKSLNGQEAYILYAKLHMDLKLNNNDFKLLKEEIEKLKLRSKLPEYNFYTTEDKYYIGYALRNEDDSLTQIKMNPILIYAKIVLKYLTSRKIINYFY